MAKGELFLAAGVGVMSLGGIVTFIGLLGSIMGAAPSPSRCFDEVQIVGVEARLEHACPVGASIEIAAIGDEAEAAVLVVCRCEVSLEQD